MKTGQRPSRHWRRVPTKRGRIPKFINPSIKKITNKQYRKAMKKMAPFADADKDGVPNWKDCRPFDRKRQDEFDDEIIERDMEERRKSRPGEGVSQKEAEKLLFEVAKPKKKTIYVGKDWEVESF